MSFTFRFLKSRKNTCSEHQGIGKCSSIQVAFLSKQLRADYLQAPVNLRSYPRAPLAKLNSIPLPTFLLWRTHSHVLFTEDLNTILARDEQLLTCLDTRVVHSPVLLTYGQDSVLLEPVMQETALNTFLQNFCLSRVLLLRNTMYSWRRDALSDMQARPGTEQARNLTGHKHNSEAIGAYTHRITTDFDVTAFHLQDSGYDPQQLRDIWWQSHSAIYQPSTTGPDLRSVLQERVEAQVVLRKDWEELNQAVKVVTRLLGLIALLTDSRTCFQKLRRSRSASRRTILWQQNDY